MTNRDRLLMMTASGIVRDIRPECMNAAEILGRVTEALATRDAEIERLRALLRDAPVLIIDKGSAHLRGETEMLAYAAKVAEWGPRAKAALSHQQSGKVTEDTK